MNILVVAKQNAAGLLAARKLEKLMRDEKGVKLLFDQSTARKLRRFRDLGTSVKGFAGDMIITLGGDGTFLWTAYQAKVPVLPVKLEGYGFLCTTDFKTLTKSINKLLHYDFTIQERLRLKCTRVKKRLVDRVFHTEFPLCLNEIAFARKRPSKILKSKFIIDKTEFDFWGDGLLFSTPSGSTAYATSAGGSMIDPSLDVIHLVPLYPFHSRIKPMIIPANKKIEVKVTQGECALIIDGHSGDYIKEGSEFIIEKGDPVKVVILDEFNFYQKFKNTYFQHS